MQRTTDDSSVVRYQAIGATLTSDTAGTGFTARSYIPGFTGQLANSFGPGIVGVYSTGKFLPGTRIRWEPSVSFVTTGRIYVGFTDNPEVAAAIDGLGTTALKVTACKGLGNVVSFPVWQETDINFPTRLRRKTFDVNATVVTSNVDVLDRCMQQFMCIAIDGAPTAVSTNLGSFVYHDVVSVEGINPIAT